MASSSLSIVVTGLITQHPQLGGITWHYLQYLLGLARLGHDVYYIEDSGESPYYLDGGASGSEWVARDCSRHVDHLAKTLSRFGFADRWAYRFPLEARWFGLSDARRQEVLRSADLLINVSGSLEDPEKYREVPRLVYIDTDPVVTHAKIAAGRKRFDARVAAHDAHFSFGECLGAAVPTTRYRWRPTRQPVVLSEWQPARSSRDVFTTVMSWTSYEPIQHGGHSYAQKDVEFRRFLDLPGRVTRGAMEIALGGLEHPSWEEDEDRASESSCERPSTGEHLRRRGWQVVDAHQVCGDLDSYRDYIRSSKAEWSVAKNAYVQGQPGWFSERSACYLASGRPVVVQHTGFEAVLPVGEGLLSFRNLDEAAAAIAEVEGRYARHSEAARSIAETYFDSDRVLARLVSEAFDDSGNAD